MRLVRRALVGAISTAGLLFGSAAFAFTASPVGPTFPIFVGQGGAVYPDIDGDQVVWNNFSAAGPSGGNQDQIWLHNIASGTTVKVRDSAGYWSSRRPRVSGSNIVWYDNRDPYNFDDIYRYQLPNGPESEVLPESNNSARNQSLPAISGNTVVWLDDIGHGDIVGKNLSSGSVFPDASDNDYQDSVAISGDIVV